MSLAANALQAAIYTRLNSQLSPVKVYDHVPQGTAYPYVMIGDDTAIPSDTKTADGQEFTVTIHAWDKAAGRKSVKTLLGQIHDALHHQEGNLTVTGHQLVMLRFDFSDSFMESGVEGNADHYYHGVIRFRAVVRTN